MDNDLSWLHPWLWFGFQSFNLNEAFYRLKSRDIYPPCYVTPEAFSLVLAGTPPRGSGTMRWIPSPPDTFELPLVYGSSSQNKWETFWRSRGHGGHMCTRSDFKVHIKTQMFRSVLVWFYSFIKKFTSHIKTPITVVASSGAELPAAMNVAPATSDSIPKTGKKSKDPLGTFNRFMHVRHSHAPTCILIIRTGIKWDLHFWYCTVIH